MARRAAPATLRAPTPTSSSPFRRHLRACAAAICYAAEDAKLIESVSQRYVDSVPYPPPIYSILQSDTAFLGLFYFARATRGEFGGFGSGEQGEDLVRVHLADRRYTSPRARWPYRRRSDAEIDGERLRGNVAPVPSTDARRVNNADRTHHHPERMAPTPQSTVTIVARTSSRCEPVRFASMVRYRLQSRSTP